MLSEAMEPQPFRGKTWAAAAILAAGEEARLGLVLETRELGGRNTSSDFITVFMPFTTM